MTTRVLLSRCASSIAWLTTAREPDPSGRKRLANAAGVPRRASRVPRRSRRAMQHRVHPMRNGRSKKDPEGLGGWGTAVGQDSEQHVVGTETTVAPTSCLFGR